MFLQLDIAGQKVASICCGGCLSHAEEAVYHMLITET